MKACLGYTDEDLDGIAPDKRSRVNQTGGDLKLKLFNTVKEVESSVDEITSRASLVASIKRSRRDSDRSSTSYENVAVSNVKSIHARQSYCGETGPVKSYGFGGRENSSNIKKMVVKTLGSQTERESLDFASRERTRNGRARESGYLKSQRVKTHGHFESLGNSDIMKCD